MKGPWPRLVKRLVNNFSLRSGIFGIVARSGFPPVSFLGGFHMKKIAPAAAFAIAAMLAASAIAGDTPTTKAECEKAQMTWDEAHGKCIKK
jgi:hypothetical protein